MTLYNVQPRLQPPVTDAIGTDTSTAHAPAWTDHHQLVTDALVELDLRIANTFVGTVTNDDAPAGYIGEYLTATATFGSLTSGVNVDVTSLSLTAGDWEVWGGVSFTAGIGAVVRGISAWVNDVSATEPDLRVRLAAVFVDGEGQQIEAIRRRFSLAGTTTVYLGAWAVFGVSSFDAVGTICARRMR